MSIVSMPSSGEPPARLSGLPGARKLELLQAVFDETPDVVLLKDENGDFLLCNQTLARLYGTTPDEMVGKHDDDFGVPKQMADGFRANVKAIMASGQAEVVFEKSRDAVTGEVRNFKSVKHPFKDAEGRNRILVIAHDLTDVVRAQERVAQSEFTLQQVMKATQEGIWDWHVPSGRLDHNDRWYEILGFDAGDIGDHVDDFVGRLHPDDRGAVWEKIGRLIEGADDHYESEHRMIRKDGTVIWVLDRGRVVMRNDDGSPVRVVGAYSDITERRHAQLVLEHALTLAESATRAKTEFLATMSHELRTPLNGILGMAHLLATSARAADQRIHYANLILRSGETLLSLVNDILEVARMEAGRLKIEASIFEPATLIVESLDAFTAAAAMKGVRLCVTGPSVVKGMFRGDGFRLRQMLTNYIGNAIKFTAQGSIAVSVTECASSSGALFLEFAVTDTGIGFAEDKHHLLFLPFSQLDGSSTREFGGSGLGLSIVAKLAEMMGGRVGATSTPGVGSRFWFRVPAIPVSDGDGHNIAMAPLPAQPTGLGNLRVLVAEDHSINREVLELQLEVLGVRADFVTDGQAAVSAIMERPPYDLVLMDVQMPGMDGVTATEQIRAWEQQQGKPGVAIVAVTSDAYEQTRRRCLDAGMDDFVVKPLGLDQMTEVLRRCADKV